MRCYSFSFWLGLSAFSLVPACSPSPTPEAQASTCPAGTSLCGAACANLASDVANCGICGNVCPAGTSCANGTCSCSAGLTSCPSGCVAVVSDPANCGGCAIACQPGQVCSAGACKGSCDAGLTPCGASCVDPATNPANCGTCGTVCGAGFGCVAGVCSCPGALINCGGACVDTSSNPLHCGTCNRGCAAGQSCAASVCLGGGTGGSGGASGSGGATSTGGVSTGGVATGGAGTGGVSSGGVSTGGVSSGGVSSGGAPTGGAGTGGVSTGGASSGGVATGGGSSGGTPGTLNGCTATISDETLSGEYQAWKTAYVVDCSATQARVQAGGNSGTPSDETFSEGIGYGMLLAATFNDQALFDKLWAYYKASIRTGHELMDWKMNACTGTYYNENAASDGDLDTAMGLVMAEHRWGGYANDANTILDAIQRLETMTCGSYTVLKPGDAWGDCASASINPSYFSPGYYRAFAAFQPAQAAFWNKFADDSITMLLDYQQEADDQALMGEWAFPDRLNDTDYGYNACRTPWRVAVDYVWWGTTGAQTFLTTVSSYVDARGGVASVPFDKNSAYLGPFALSGIATNKCDAYYQSWMSGAEWDDRYFQGTLRVLAMALMAGKFVY